MTGLVFIRRDTRGHAFSPSLLPSLSLPPSFLPPSLSSTLPLQSEDISRKRFLPETKSDLELPRPQKIIFCWLSCLVYGILLQQPELIEVPYEPAADLGLFPHLGNKAIENPLGWRCGSVVGRLPSMWEAKFHPQNHQKLNKILKIIKSLLALKFNVSTYLWINYLSIHTCLLVSLLLSLSE